jgi:hypothetical protein
VKHKRPLVVKAKEDPFAMALQSDNALAENFAIPSARPTKAQWLLANADAADAAANEMRPNLSDDGFHFGEFWHGNLYGAPMHRGRRVIIRH